MSDNELQRAAEIIDRIVSGLSFLPMSWEEAFDEKLVQEIKSFMAAHSNDSQWQPEDEETE